MVSATGINLEPGLCSECAATEVTEYSKINFTQLSISFQYKSCCHPPQEVRKAFTIRAFSQAKESGLYSILQLWARCFDVGFIIDYIQFSHID